MPCDMYGDVILTRDVTERGLRAGDVGTVVERHVVPGVPEEGYSVEFIDMTGRNSPGRPDGRPNSGGNMATTSAAHTEYTGKWATCHRSRAVNEPR
jgi:Domain of unknown function (DUF4926)